MIKISSLGSGSGFPCQIVHDLLEITCLVFVLQIIQLLHENLLWRICI